MARPHTVFLTATIKESSCHMWRTYAKFVFILSSRLRKQIRGNVFSTLQYPCTVPSKFLVRATEIHFPWSIKKSIDVKCGEWEFHAIGQRDEFIDQESDHLSIIRGSVVGWGTMLQARKSLVLFPMRLPDFSFDLIFSPALWPRSWFRT
jgi:hypothetical protein